MSSSAQLRLVGVGWVVGLAKNIATQPGLAWAWAELGNTGWTAERTRERVGARNAQSKDGKTHKGGQRNARGW